MRRVAIIGTGIAGLGAARRLAPHADITLFEKNAWIGGHSHTVDVVWGPHTTPVDTGFIVYNEKNYPNLTRLFAELGVPTEGSDMSFGVSLDDGRLEYGTERYNAIFGQRRNVLNPRFLGLLLDILRFFRTAPKVLEGGPESRHDGGPTLGDWLERSKFGRAFIEDHLLPMAAAIWSCPTAVMLDFPLISFLRFFHNHGLLTLGHTIHGAMMRLYMLERACELELISRQLGEEPVFVDEYVQQKARERMQKRRQSDEYGLAEFQGLTRTAERLGFDWKR